MKRCVSAWLLTVHSSNRRMCSSGPATNPNITEEHQQQHQPPQQVQVTESHVEGISIVSLSHPPVNTLTSTVLRDLLNVLRRLADPQQTTSHCRGVVITSSLPNVFSSGLDLKLMTQEPFDAAAFAHYWAQFQELFLTLHAYPLPLVAAVNGTAPAAGCIIACACDYRVMVRQAASGKKQPFYIGIPAVRAGFVVPPYVAQSLAYTVGLRKAELLLTRGELLSAEEAHSIGLVDEVVTTKEDAIDVAVKEVTRCLELPGRHTWWLVKDHMRRPLLQTLRRKEGRADDTVCFTEMLQSPQIKNDLKEYLGRLSSRAQQ